MATASNSEPDEIARELAERHSTAIGGPICALRAIVAELGHIRAEDIVVVADVFNLSRAEVRGIVSFYTDLRTEPPARNIVRICQAEACQSVGARALTRSLTENLGIALGEATADGRVELEAVYCLGLCASAPAAMVNDELVAFAENADDILRGLE